MLFDYEKFLFKKKMWFLSRVLLMPCILLRIYKFL